MIAKIVKRGSRASGLMMYLFSDGKANEHTDPHVVASSGAAELPGGVWYPGDEAVQYQGSELTAREVLQLGDAVESDWRWHSEKYKIVREAGESASRDDAGPELAGVTTDSERFVDEPWDGVKAGSGKNQHVFHAALSLSVKDGQLSDEKWGKIVADYMRELGFGDADSVAGHRWVAVRHGLTTGGNDHIHIVASMVAADGARWDERKSFQRSRSAADRIERKYGLTVLKDNASQVGEPSFSAAEAARERAAGRVPGADPEVARLARVVRATAVRTATEAEWISELRRQGVRLRPRFKQGGRSEVVGYSAALGGQANPAFKAGRTLGSDLTITALRKGWSETESSRVEAIHLWTKRQGVRPVKVERSSQNWNQAQRDIAAYATRLEGLPLSDQQAATAARDASALWGQLALSTPGKNGVQYAHISRHLAKDAQRRGTELSPRSKAIHDAGRSLSLTARAMSPSTARSTLALLEQMLRVTKAVADAQRARGERIAAERLMVNIGPGLRPIREDLNQQARRASPVRLNISRDTRPHNDDRGR